MKKLTARERAFCGFYCELRDARAAAEKAGFKKSAAEGEAMLGREEIVEEVARLSALKNRETGDIASAGYRRLAFGDISDAVSLLFMKEPGEEELRNMDLFLVSEIKKPRDGNMEIKFFDRLKALEKLEQQVDSDGGAQRLIEAIERGARSLERDGGED